MTPREMRRLYLIIRMFLIYGLDELIPKIRLTLPLRMGRYLFSGYLIVIKKNRWVSACVWHWNNLDRYGSSSVR